MNKKTDFLKAYREESMFERRELAQPHMSYAYEKEKYRVIREGRVDLLDSVARIPPDGTEGILSKDALRHQKNMLIAAITIFTRYAMDGGLPEELAYAMSDSYILKGEECTSAEELGKLSDRAFREYTYAVARNRHYSSKIEAALHYITIHLHEKITLENAADACKALPEEKRRITLTAGQTSEHVIALHIANPYEEPLSIKGGKLLSSKHDGEGQGLKSVRLITEKYDGFLDIIHENHIFEVKVLLNF